LTAEAAEIDEEMDMAIPSFWQRATVEVRGVCPGRAGTINGTRQGHMLH